VKWSQSSSFYAISVKTTECSHSAIFGPLVLSADLLFFLGSEIIGNIEGLSDLLWRLALDHVCDGFAANIKEGLDVKIVASLVKEC
jgi:hypothetical protein